MSREQAKQNLIAIGIEEPTETQISDYLNQVGGETKRFKDDSEKIKEYEAKNKDLEAQLEIINNQNLTDIELAKKDTEKANSRVADLEKQIAVMTRKAKLAEKGIVGELADKLVNEKGELDIDILGQIITDRETTAKSQMEKALLENTPDPKGSDTPKTEVTNALAESVGKSVAQANETVTNVLSNYL